METLSPHTQNGNPTKRCIKCEKDLPATPEFFHRDKIQQDGLRSCCKKCRNESLPKYHYGFSLEAIAKPVDKQCCSCKRTLPATSEFFHLRRNSKDGLQGFCRSCVKTRDARTYRERNLKARFNLTESEYQRMFEAQHGLCAVCRQPETRANQYSARRLNVDHSHASGRIRGLLCSNCNTALGLLQDDSEIIKALLAYLEE